jgi:5-hydroxyisourate hydrolase
MSAITTHVLDLSRGCPAAGVPVILEREAAGSWELIGGGMTDADGRITDLLPGESIAAGIYRLLFNTGKYFAAQNTQTFYPEVTVTFRIEHSDQHYHVPLLVSPFGYSTYRGS